MSSVKKYVDPSWNNIDFCAKYLRHHYSRTNPDHDRSEELILDTLNNKNFKDHTVCDFGCGGGDFSVRLVRTSPINLRSVVNFEPSKVLIQEAKSNISSENLGEKIKFVKDISDLPEHSIDICTMHRVINAANETALPEIFRNIHRILCKQGFLFASIFDLEALTPEQRAKKIIILDQKELQADSKKIENGTRFMPRRSTGSQRHSIIDFFYKLDFINEIAASYGLNYVSSKRLESTDSNQNRRTPIMHVIYSK